ncbi:hypothetical protein NDU88_000281 [Pleurodeles waltl]|uniref:Uncharacterized protein n=1 Tax=Pleurodeles waltl TaxID=8319 RepID=A0AAV7VT11_PLEWA|nr:hypothetical protein NDU88_000281 [Pleurodeles waltl]
MAYVGSAVGPEVPVGAASGESLRQGPDLRRNCERPAVVVNGSGLGQGQIPLLSPTISYSHDRCITPVMGRPHGKGGDPRPMVSGGNWTPSQSSGVPSDLTSIESIPSLSQGESSAGVHRQHYRHVVLQQTRRSGVVDPLLRGSSPLDLAGTSGHFPGGSIPGGLLECQSRQTQPTMRGRSRMASPSGVGATSLLSVGRTLVRLVCPSRERAVSAVCAFEFPRWHSLSNAFRRKWNSGLLYTFPPIPLLPRVLKKIRQDRAQVILVAPDWARRV